MTDRGESLQSKSDLELIRAFNRGSKECFTALYKRYRNAIYRFVYYMLGSRKDYADDITQEVFVKMYCRASIYKPTGKFSSWLYGVARYTVLKHIRKHKDVYKSVSLDSVLTESHPVIIGIKQGQGGSKKGPLQISISHEERVLVQSALLKLPPSDREILVLCDLNEIPHQEVADLMGMTLINLNVRLHRSRKKLAKAMGLKDEYFEGGGP